MDERHYYRDPYLRELDAKIVRVTDKGVILDHTIAYPEGGGQPGDTGTLNGIRFTDTVKEGDNVLHITSGSFSVGDEVHIVLDWDHRYFYMQQHTAQHMLSGLLYTHFNIGTVAVHQGEDILTIETDRSEIDESVLLQLEELAIRTVCENHKVDYLEMSHAEAESMGLRRSIKVEGDVRLVRIEGVDLIACGGLHVASTGEIGELSYAGCEAIRGHVRTIWRCASSARAHRLAESAAMRSISTLFSAASPQEAYESAKDAVASIKELKSELRNLERSAAELTLACNPEGHIIETDLPLSAFQNLRDCLLILSSAGGRLTWLMHVDDAVFRTMREHFSALDMKGGGRGGVYQGSAGSASHDAIIKCFLEIIDAK